MDDNLSTRAQIANRPSAGMRTIVGAVLVAFLLGAAAAWYLTGGAATLSELFTVSREEPSVSASPSRLAGERAAPLAPDAADVAGLDSLDQRVAEMEQRLARLDVQAQAAGDNAARAEGLLIAFATRRAVERGAQLGYLADQLRIRFGSARPDAVRTVIEAAREPVTLDRLLARLDGLAPRLAQPPAGEGTFGWLSRQVGSLFIVRREDAPSPAPERRIERARLFLESGRAGAAASEIRNMPNAEAARDWIEDAERYAATQRALEQIELAALIENRELRDAEGERVEQPSAVLTP